MEIEKVIVSMHVYVWGEEEEENERGLVAVSQSMALCTKVIPPLQ